MARKEVRTYTNLFKYEKTLFAIQDMQLPIPLPYRMILSFIVAFVTLIFITRLPLLGVFSQKYLIMALIAGFISWFFTKQTLEGKRPDRFIIRLIIYYFSHRRINRYAPAPKPNVYKYSGTVTYRIAKDGDENDIQENN